MQKLAIQKEKKTKNPKDFMRTATEDKTYSRKLLHLNTQVAHLMSQ